MTPRLRTLRRVVATCIVCAAACTGAAFGLDAAGEPIAAKVAAAADVGFVVGGVEAVIAYKREQRRSRELE